MPRFIRDEVELNLAPMLDVVLLLLCFFILTARFGDTVTPTNTLDLTLPSSKGEERLSPDALLIDVAADGQVMLDGTRFQLGDGGLARKLEDRAARDADVVIRADVATPHGTVIKVMDLAKSLGYDALRVATQTDATNK